MISLSPDEVERRFALLRIPNRFTAEEKLQRETTIIVPQQSEVFALPVPKANDGLSLLTLRKLLGTDPSRPPAFFDHPWYLDEPFAQTDCEPGWHYLYADVLPDSISQPVHYANSLGNAGLGLPTAVEIALMLFLHYAGTGEQLLHKKHTWCKDRASTNRWVTVGAFGRNGLFVSGHPADFTSRGLGICPRLKP